MALFSLLRDLSGKPKSPEMTLPVLDTPELDTTFSASINVTATILVAQLNDTVQRIAANQLNNLIQADQRILSILGGGGER
jgi:hypothetical protein